MRKEGENFPENKKAKSRGRKEPLLTGDEIEGRPESTEKVKEKNQKKRN